MAEKIKYAADTPIMTDTVDRLVLDFHDVRTNCAMAAEKIEVLVDTLGVDPQKFKDALVMKALTNMAEGKPDNYEGNLYKDLLEMVERLKGELKSEEDKCQYFVTRCREYNERIDELLLHRSKAVKILQHPHLCTSVEWKRKYTCSDIRAVIDKATDGLAKTINEAVNELLE